MLTKIYTDLTNEEFEVIERYASNVPEGGMILEIGTGKGGSAVLLKQSTDRVGVITVDPLVTVDIQDALADSNVVSVKGTSSEFAQVWDSNYKIHLLFIDGGHDFNSIMTDVQEWLPRLTEDGIVIFDDYEQPQRGGVANLAIKICLDTLLATGVLLLVERHKKLLVAKATRTISPYDIDQCYKNFMYLDSKDGTDRAKCERLGQALPHGFWGYYNKANKPIAFRRCAETYYMLQLTKGLEPYTTEGGIRWLTKAIATKQVELNILRLGIESL